MLGDPAGKPAVIEAQQGLQDVQPRRLCRPRAVAAHRQGRVRLPDRAERRRQVDAAAAAAAPGDPDAKGASSSGSATCRKLSLRQVQAYRRSLGFVFQDFKLLPNKTVLDNVAFVPRVLGMAPSQQQRRTFQVLKWVGLQHRMNAYPMELSGGEQQRIAIARALVNDPVIILADEPTGNLDPDLSLEIMNLFREINARGTTVLVATHDRELIRRVGRRTLSLDHGSVVEATLMRALQYFFSEAAESLWRNRQRGGAVDADDRRRAVRARLLPDDQRQHPAHRRALERRGGAGGLPARRRAAGPGGDDQRDADEERPRGVGAVRLEGRGAQGVRARLSRTSRRPRTALERNPVSRVVRGAAQCQRAGGDRRGRQHGRGAERRRRRGRRALRPHLARAAERAPSA